MGNIAIVTDSSSDITPAQADAAGIRLVPLSVSFGDESFEAGTEMTNEEFYERLTVPGAPLPRTAAANPGQFEVVYRDALDNGAESVVCVTLTSKLSATYSAAVHAAGEFEAGTVEVVDSMTAAQPLGLMVKRAADLASSGASQSDIVDLVQDLAGRTDLIFATDTLEYLQKGGRVSRTSALVGTMLSMKPILKVEDGLVISIDRQRTMAKARARLLELAGQGEIEQIAVIHSGAADLEAFVESVAAVGGCTVAEVEVGMIGPVAGTHAGPGMIGITRIFTG